MQIEYGSVLARRVNRVIFRSDWRHTVLTRHANVVGESKNMKHVKRECEEDLREYADKKAKKVKLQEKIFLKIERKF